VNCDGRDENVSETAGGTSDCAPAMAAAPAAHERRAAAGVALPQAEINWDRYDRFPSSRLPISRLFYTPLKHGDH
jgi:hypothetical protein